MLFNVQLGYPRWLKGTIPTGKKTIVFGEHARERMFDKGGLRLPSSCIFDFSLFRVVEIETAGRIITKMVVRKTHNDEFDLCMAIIPKTKGVWFAKTVWLNRVDDNHSTLDTSRFS